MNSTCIKITEDTGTRMREQWVEFSTELTSEEATDLLQDRLRDYEQQLRRTLVLQMSPHCVSKHSKVVAKIAVTAFRVNEARRGCDLVRNSHGGTKDGGVDHGD